MVLMRFPSNKSEMENLWIAHPWEMKTKSVSSASGEVGMGLPARKPLFLLLTPLAIITLLFLVLPLESVSPLFSLLPLSKRGR